MRISPIRMMGILLAAALSLTVGAARAADPPEVVSQTLLKVSGIILKQDFAGAAAVLRKALVSSPNEHRYHYSLGMVLKLAGKKDEAILETRKAAELDPKNPDYLDQLGTLLMETRDYGGAADVFRKWAALAPDSAPVHYQFAVALDLQGKTDEAIAEYRRTVELPANLFHGPAALHLGSLLLKKQDLPGALAEYRKAVDLDPKDSQAQFGLGLVLARQGQVDEGVAALRKGLALDAGMPSAIPAEQLAAAFPELQSLQPQWGDALDAFRTAAAQKPNNAAAQFGLGLVLERLKKEDEALAAYRKAAELDPKDPDLLEPLGRLLFMKQDYAAAAEVCRKGIELQPQNAGIYGNLGAALIGQKKFQEALVPLQKAVDLDPKDADHRSSLGEAYAALDRKPEAIAAYRKAAELDPEEASALYQAGTLLLDLNRLDEAIQAFREVLKRDPNYTGAYYELGQGYRKKGQRPQAIQAYEKFIALTGKDPDRAPFVTRARTYLRQLKIPAK